MKIPYLTCLVLVAGSLAVTAVDVAPASAGIDGTVHPVTDEAVPPISKWKLGSVGLHRESVEPNTVALTKTAASRVRNKVRMRKTPTIRRKRTTRKPASSIDLPIKILTFEDNDGSGTRPPPPPPAPDDCMSCD